MILKAFRVGVVNIHMAQYCVCKTQFYLLNIARETGRWKKIPKQNLMIRSVPHVGYY
jgi:hypothetical protein